jgi:hypothetical protein
MALAGVTVKVGTGQLRRGRRERFMLRTHMWYRCLDSVRGTY